MLEQKNRRAAQVVYHYLNYLRFFYFGTTNVTFIHILYHFSSFKPHKYLKSEKSTYTYRYIFLWERITNLLENKIKKLRNWGRSSKIRITHEGKRSQVVCILCPFLMSYELDWCNVTFSHIGKERWTEPIEMLVTISWRRRKRDLKKMDGWMDGWGERERQRMRGRKTSKGTVMQEKFN